MDDDFTKYYFVFHCNILRGGILIRKPIGASINHFLATQYYWPKNVIIHPTWILVGDKSIPEIIGELDNFLEIKCPHNSQY